MHFLSLTVLKRKVFFFARQKLMYAWTAGESFRWIDVKSHLVYGIWYQRPRLMPSFLLV